MVNFDTYFMNTIPRKRATYTIHKEWASEVLHAQRMELQKRDGTYNYRTTNYAFIYWVQYGNISLVVLSTETQKDTDWTPWFVYTYYTAYLDIIYYVNLSLSQYLGLFVLQ